MMNYEFVRKNLKSGRRRLYACVGAPVKSAATVLLTIAILYAALLHPIYAEGIEVNAGIDRAEITVGDPFVYIVQVVADEGTVVNVPHLPTEWGNFTILSQQPIAGENLTPEAGKITTGRMYSITTYRVGEFATPPLTIRYQKAGGEWQEHTTAPISITVVSVLTATENVTDTMELRGLKPLATMHPIYTLWLGYALLIISIALLAWWGYNYWQRRKRAAELVPQKVVDTRPPYVIAYEELDRIEAEKLPEQGMLKVYYTRVSDCIREYAARLYDIPALDRTTDEFLGELRRAKIDRGHWAMFHRLLEESDLVKFAKYKPPVHDAHEALEHARLIVNVTKPEELSAVSDQPLEDEMTLRAES